MGHYMKFKKAAVGLSLGALLAVSAAVPALAVDQVTSTVTGGDLTASIADLDLGAVPYSHSSQTDGGAMTLTVDDSTGSGAGWNVTVQASNFVHDGGGDPIDATNFILDTANTPTATAGQTVDPTEGPLADTANNGQSLATARRVIYANAGFGMGTYTQALDVELTIPGQTLAGTYTSTLIVTEAAGPGS